MSLRKTFVLTAILAVAAILVAIGFLHRYNGPPNVLLVTIDTLRSDHCSAYGYGRPTTPALDRIAHDGTRFEVAYSVSSTTAPSHATLLSGLYPLSHGVMKNGHTLANQPPLLQEAFRSHGYETAAFVSSFVLNNRFGFGRGFQVFDDSFTRSDSSIDWRRWQGNKVEGGFDRRANETTDHALQWMQRRDNSRPFFLWIHYFDPHYPYDPPEPFRSEFAKGRPAGEHDMNYQMDLYDGEIRFVSEQLARVLSFLDQGGLSDRTLLVVTSDHGEGFMEHGITGHGRNLYEEAVRVPLIFRWPGHVRAARTIHSPVGIIDVAPTLNFLAGLQMANLKGVNLAPFLAGEQDSDNERKIFLHRRRFKDFNGDMFGLRWKNFKLLNAEQQGIREMYDLNRDPREEYNIAANVPGKTIDDFIADLHHWESSNTVVRTEPEQISTEDDERLKALGYVQ